MAEQFQMVEPGRSRAPVRSNGVHIFCASTLYFLVQMEVIPKNILDKELRTMLH